MLELSPFYMAVMAFCFSMTIGVLWEFFEWGVDTFMAKDMQKDTVLQAIHSVTLHPEGRNIPVHIRDIADVILVHTDGTQTALGVGGYLDIGLIDTMSDLLEDAYRGKREIAEIVQNYAVDFLTACAKQNAKEKQCDAF